MIETKVIDLEAPESQMHWGKYIESTEPITGVGNEREVGYLAEEVHNNGIDPIFEEYVSEHPDEEIDEWETSELLLGVIKAEDGKYDIDPNAPFTVLWSNWAGGTYQILKSPYVQFCTPCSPCCPGQVSLGQPGNYLGFSPSIEDFDEKDTVIPEVWVWDLEHEIFNAKRVLVDLALRSLTASLSGEQRAKLHAKEDEIEPYLECLSSALAENKTNPNRRIIVKQQRIQ